MPGLASRIDAAGWSANSRPSTRSWLKSRPRLSTSDLRHATPAGYELIGNLYYRAMLKAFAGYLASGESS